MENNEENQLPDPTTENTTEAVENAPIENISLGDAMAGVFTEPGSTFESVKSSVKKNYWLVPILIVIAVSILSSFLVMKDEELVSEIRAKQKEAIKKQMDEAVKNGKMTREQADQQIEQTEKMFGGGMFVVFGMIGSVFGVLIIFFLKALVYWGGLKLFKGEAGYGAILNVLGLAALITAIQLAIDTVLAILMGKLLMNIGPVLLFSEESVGKQMYTLLANFDLLNIWYNIVVGIGLAKVSKIKPSITITFVFVLWLVWVLLTSFGPLGMFMGR